MIWLYFNPLFFFNGRYVVKNFHIFENSFNFLRLPHLDHNLLAFSFLVLSLSCDLPIFSRLVKFRLRCSKNFENLCNNSQVVEFFQWVLTPPSPLELLSYHPLSPVEALHNPWYPVASLLDENGRCMWK